jgi:alpha-D-ribose 1-methylphosphonate 5-triphosphate synthase subunit PhnG
MEDPHDRTDRFELIAVCEGDALARVADKILAADPPLSVRQEPRPQLVMQRVREPVERRPFNLGEVVVTPAEVDLDGTRGFAMRPGKAEREALSGAVVDAAVAGGHRLTGEAVETLRDARAEYENRREREWDRSQHTAVDFGVMEDDL